MPKGQLVPDWLPPRILLSNFGGDWGAYAEALWGLFKADFIDYTPRISGNGESVGLLGGMRPDGKHWAFWHAVSRDHKDAAARLIDVPRCEVLPWARAVIEHPSDGSVHRWENERDGERRVLTSLNDWSYLVVLNRRDNAVVLWTAYLVDQEHTKRKMRKEWLDYVSA